MHARAPAFRTAQSHGKKISDYGASDLDSSAIERLDVRLIVLHRRAETDASGPHFDPGPERRPGVFSPPEPADNERTHGSTADDVRLRQVFYNLLDNAIKYTPEGGTVEISSEARDKHAVVTVRDTGIGIAPEHLPRVFDRFYRVDKARSRDQGGTGLGLSIARTIVAAHGGQIDVASVAEKGTTCTVTLPRS